MKAAAITANTPTLAVVTKYHAFSSRVKIFRKANTISLVYLTRFLLRCLAVEEISPEKVLVVHLLHLLRH